MNNKKSRIEKLLLIITLIFDIDDFIYSKSVIPNVVGVADRQQGQQLSLYFLVSHTVNIPPAHESHHQFKRGNGSQGYDK